MTLSSIAVIQSVHLFCVLTLEGFPRKAYDNVSL